MTQPIDPLNPPGMGLGIRAGMFSGAMTCPGCGFATSDIGVYDCPNCGLMWRPKPKPVEIVQGPAAGEPVRLNCILCQLGPEAGEMVFAGGSDLAHKACLEPSLPAPEPEPETPVDVPKGYLAVVKAAPQKKAKKKKVHVHNLNAQGHCGCGYDQP